MKRIVSIMAALALVTGAFAQLTPPIRQNDSTPFPEFLKGVKYAEVLAPKLLVEEMLKKNENVVTAHIRSIYEYLKSMGFRQVVFAERNPLDMDSLQSLCELVSVKVTYVNQKRNVTELNIRFEGCDHKVFYEFDEKCKIPVNSVQAYKKEYARFIPEKLPEFDPLKTLTLSCLGRSEFNELSVRGYLDSLAVDPIEGIYELQNFESALRIAVVRSRSNYNIIYLSGFRNSVDWPEGELFGRIRITSRQQFYTGEWCGFNKSHYTSVSCMHSGNNLLFTLGSVQYNFAKTYPAAK